MSPSRRRERRGRRAQKPAHMARELARGAVFIFAIGGGQSFLTAGPAQVEAASIEIALVANAEAGTVALVDVVSRSIVGAVDVNPGREWGEGPGATNYAQDTDVSLTGERSMSPAATSATWRRSTW
jgi:hypothetical protein